MGINPQPPRRWCWVASREEWVVLQTWHQGHPRDTGRPPVQLCPPCPAAPAHPGPLTLWKHGRHESICTSPSTGLCEGAGVTCGCASSPSRGPWNVANTQWAGAEWTRRTSQTRDDFPLTERERDREDEKGAGRGLWLSGLAATRPATGQHFQQQPRG